MKLSRALITLRVLAITLGIVYGVLVTEYLFANIIVYSLALTTGIFILAYVLRNYIPYFKLNNERTIRFRIVPLDKEIYMDIYMKPSDMYYGQLCIYIINKTENGERTFLTYEYDVKSIIHMLDMSRLFADKIPFVLGEFVKRLDSKEGLSYYINMETESIHILGPNNNP